MGAGTEAPRIHRLRTAAEFKRLLRTRPHVISAHFAVHHLAPHEDSAVPTLEASARPDLSTDGVGQPVHNVDDWLRTDAQRWRFGDVVPKRHARRAVTRSLLKREMRAAFRRRVACLDRGAWLVRLRSAFEPQRFPSAASKALRQAARTELEELLRRCEPSSSTLR